MLLAVAGGAAQTTVLTLDECRRLAVENNARVKVAAGKAEAAEQTRREAFTRYFPQVAADGLYFHASRPVFHFDVMDLFAIEFLKKGTFASVSAVQPVFAGGRIVNGNRLAKVGVEAGNLEKEGAVDDVLLTVEQYYWKLVALKAKKRTLESVIVMVDSLEHQVSTAVNAGIVLRNDLLKVQLKANEYRSLMVDLDNGISLSLKQLAQYVGRDGESIDIPAADVPAQVPAYPQAIYVEPGAALPSTVDYRLLDAKVRAADLETKMAVGEYLPTVGVGAGWFYDDIFNQKWNFGAVFVNVAIPISGWWGGSYAVKRSKIEASNARLEKDNLSQMLTLRMDNAWDDLTASHRKMSIAHESIAQADENLRLNRNYYNAGLTTITDLLDAQTLYRQAADGYAEAYCGFCECRARYLDATGRPLDI